MPVINGVYLKDFTALPGAVADANIIPIAISGDNIAYRTTVAGIITDARVTSKLLTGLSVTGGAVVSTDTILQAFGKVQNQLNSKVTSVGLSMPSAFTVTNSPVTGSGTLTVTGAGLASQYIRGDGQLADFPTGGGGGGSSVSYYLNGSVNQGTFVGNTYYEMNKTPVLGAGTNFTIAADGYISQFITDANDPNVLLIPGGNWNFETYLSASSGGGSPTFYVELYKYNGTAFTLIASNSATPELIAFGTNIAPYYSSLAVPETVLLATDRLAIRIYVAHSGRTITLHTENSHLCQVITTFTTGLQSLNGLSKQAQYFAVGTSGNDFNISSSNDTHTFNIPNADSSARGVVSTGTQSFAGVKTFLNNIKSNDQFYIREQNALNLLANYTQVQANNTYFAFTNGAGTGSATFTYNGSHTYTLPGATGTIALTSALSGYLPLTGGTLSTTNISETLRIVNGGTGYALYVQSNSFFQGDVTFQSGFKSPTNTFTLPAATGTIALTSDLSGYLPLSGGTLTGALSGTSASFSSTATASAFIPTGSAVPTNGMYLSGTNTLAFATNSTNRLSISSTGAATFGGDVILPYNKSLAFNSISDQYITADSSNLYLGTANSARLIITSAGNLQPGADNAYSLGISGTRWSAVWAANGTIQTSDEREKKDIINSDLGLEFISKLRPVSFKWKVGINKVTSEKLVDEDGNESLKEIITPVQGKRTHYGLIAQEVKEALGDVDFGGFIHDSETDIMGLRYDQFIPLLIKSIQELKAEIDLLKGI